MRSRWLSVLLVMLLPQLCAAAEVVGYLAEFSNVVESPRSAILAQSDKPRDLHLGDTVITKDSVDERGAARVYLANRETISLAGNSELVIGDMETPDGMRSTTVQLNYGRIRVYVSPGSHFQVQTAAGVVTSRHTEFVVAVERDSQAMDVVVIDGVVEVSGIGAVAAAPVAVCSYMMLHAAAGQRLGAPSLVSAAGRTQFTAGLELIGHGTSERLSFGRELLDGSGVLVVDRPERQRPHPWGPDPRQEQPGSIGDPLFGVPGSLVVDY